MDESIEGQPQGESAPRPPARISRPAPPPPAARPDFKALPERRESKLGRAWRRDWVFIFALLGAVISIYGATRLETHLWQPFPEFIASNGLPPAWNPLQKYLKHSEPVPSTPGTPAPPIIRTASGVPTGGLPILGAGLFLFAIGCLGAPMGAIGARPCGVYSGGGPRRERRKWLRRAFGLLLMVTGLLFGAWCFYDSYWNPTMQPVTIWGYDLHLTGGPGLDGPIALYSAVILLVMGAAWMETRRRSWFADMGFAVRQPGRAWWQGDAVWLLLFMGLWFAANVYKLDQHFGFYTGDESSAVLIGRWVFTKQPVVNSVSVPWGYRFDANLCCFPRAWFYVHGGDRPMFYARLYTLCVSTLLVGTFFVLARALVGRAAAWVALVLCSTSHAILYFSRVGLTNCDAILLICLFILTFHSAWRTRRMSLALLAGLLAGLSHYFYRGAMIVIPITGLVLLLSFLSAPRTVWRRWALIAAMAAGFVFASVPDRVAFRDSVENGAWRRDTVFLLSKGNLENQFKETEASNLPTALVRYSWPALGGIMLWPHSGQEWDYASNKIPLLGARLSVLHILGLIAVIAFWRRRMSVLLVGSWWIMLLIVGSLLTINAPYIPRILSIFACGGIMAGWVLTSLAARARRLFGVVVAVPVLLAGLAYVGWIAYFNTHHYYFEYITNTKNVGYTMFPPDLATFFRKFPTKDTQLYMWNKGGWSSFSSSALQAVDFGISREEYYKDDPPPPPVPGKRTAYVVAIPECAGVDAQLAAMFPSVKPLEITNSYRPELPPTHHVYWVEPNTPVATPAPAAPAVTPAPEMPATTVTPEAPAATSAPETPAATPTPAEAAATEAATPAPAAPVQADQPTTETQPVTGP